MHGDFSCVGFDKTKHFSALLKQQGRVELESDGNEQTAILLHYLRTAVADLVGPAGVPDSTGGFEIAPATGGAVPDLSISPGRMYVDGILCENDAEGVTYWTQPDGFLDPDRSADRLPERPYLVYLRVWERLITAIEDPGIREVALGLLAPDTAARSKVVWQVAVHAPDGDDGTPSVDEWLGWLADLREPRGRLRARALRPSDADEDVCNVSPEARYRGPENQLYRVEVHNGGPARPPEAHTTRGRGAGRTCAGVPGEDFATFKWSRENGSVAFPIVSIAEDVVELATLGRDGKLGLEIGDWVEIVDDEYACRLADDDPQEPLPALHRVVTIDPADRLVGLDPSPDAGRCGLDAGRHPLLRRWDHHSCAGSEKGEISVATDNALPIVEGAWLDLEDGVGVYFQPSPGANGSAEPRRYRRGDYWIIPARTVTGDVVWPQDENGPMFRPPDGVEYHYAPLAIVSAGAPPQDLRAVFSPVTKARLAPAGDTEEDGAPEGTDGDENGPGGAAGGTTRAPAAGAGAARTAVSGRAAGETAAERKPSAGRSAAKPAGRSAAKPAGKPAGRSAGKPAGRSAGKPAGRSAGKPAEKPADKPTAKPSPARPAGRAPSPATSRTTPPKG